MDGEILWQGESKINVRTTIGMAILTMLMFVLGVIFVTGTHIDKSIESAIPNGSFWFGIIWFVLGTLMTCRVLIMIFGKQHIKVTKEKISLRCWGQVPFGVNLDAITDYAMVGNFWRLRNVKKYEELLSVLGQLGIAERVPV